MRCAPLEMPPKPRLPMTTKAEIAAVMASDGDSEKKISLLKKAVVSVTRQKQELEAKLSDTLVQLAEASGRASSETETNAKLRKRIQTLEAELEQERNKGKNFGQNVLKGLSSLMNGNDEGGSGAVASAGGAGGAARTGVASPTLNAEDVEKIVRENQQLHMEVYALRSKRDDAKRTHHGEKDRYLKEISSLQHEVGELRGLLNATTSACDDLNYQCVYRQAIAQFCFTFLRPVRATNQALTDHTIALILQTGDPQHSTNATASPKDTVRQLTPDQQAEIIAGTLTGYASCLRTLVNGVSVVLLTLRDKLPRSQRATIGDLRSFATRLATLVEAHALQKERVLFLASQLDELVQILPSHPPEADDSAAAAPQPRGSTQGHVVRLQQDILEAVLEWLRLLRSHMALLVESSVASLPQGQTYSLSVWPPDIPPGTTITKQPWEGLLKRTVVEREVFVEHVTKTGELALCRMEGSLEAVSMVLGRASAEFNADIDALGPVWLVALQQLWLEGVNAQPRLRWEVAAFSTALCDVAEACSSAALRDSLKHVVLSLRVCARSTDATTEEAFLAVRACPQGFTGALCAAANGSADTTTWPESAQARTRAVAVSQSNHDEVLSALAAADRAAVCYYTQMNATLLELADREDMLHAVEGELQRTQVLLEEKTAESERTRLVLQDQIRLLSDRLVQYTHPQRHNPSSLPGHDTSAGSDVPRGGGTERTRTGATR